MFDSARRRHYGQRDEHCSAGCSNITRERENVAFAAAYAQSSIPLTDEQIETRRTIRNHVLALMAGFGVWVIGSVPFAMLGELFSHTLANWLAAFGGFACAALVFFYGDETHNATLKRIGKWAFVMGLVLIFNTLSKS